MAAPAQAASPQRRERFRASGRLKEQKFELFQWKLILDQVTAAAETGRKEAFWGFTSQWSDLTSCQMRRVSVVGRALGVSV